MGWAARRPAPGGGGGGGAAADPAVSAAAALEVRDGGVGVALAVKPARKSAVRKKGNTHLDIDRHARRRYDADTTQKDRQT